MRSSIFAKFTVSFIAAGLVPLLIISYFSLSTFSGYMERYAVGNFEQMLLFAGKNVEDLHNKYNTISKLMYTYGVDGYGQLGEAITAQSSAGDRRLRSTVDDFLRTVLYSDNHLQNTAFVMPGGQIQWLHKETKALDSQYAYPPDDWAEQLKNKPKGLAFAPTHPEKYFIGSNQRVITFGRNLVDVNAPVNAEASVIGMLFMDVKMSAFEEVFNQMKLGEKDEVYVIDGEGYVLYSNKPDKIGIRYDVRQSEDSYI
jgi:two-component system sensor histidine kinase YesM